MTPTEVSVTRRKPKEEYGFEEIKVSATLEKGDDLQEELASLKAEVEQALDAEAAPAEKKKVSKKTKSKPVVKDEDDEQEEDTDGDEDEEGQEEDDEEDDEEEDDEDDEDKEEEDDEEEDKGKKKVSKKGPKVRKKAATYSRENEIHKKKFGEELSKYDPKWKATTKGKSAAKKVSEKLEGNEFLDDEGEILPSFVKTLRRAYAAATK